ncbi:hypothetical protein SEA_PEPE_72 [Mycobacterium phage Pepe]|uniref:Uncharacterized protein n=1 Tax=Mycobacterium phage SkiPole TaxID=701456 RepID=D2XRT1_9CAUD|nr:hypothetical protein CL86_gp087 [Mycobacterium phage SkiPole]YP_009189943.1 hypothetical protein SEA_PEPE_72 [Mycobacterium phage Pepe]ADA83807.1 hypothetical protein SKIPOLE_87 [Mycobacterium phage SkiPole]ALK87046.1 hypothetical protein SEA_PEPE_72 [Mycobacterium phage Pepe]
MTSNVATKLINLIHKSHRLDGDAASVTVRKILEKYNVTEKPGRSRIVKMAERKGRIFGGAWERAMRIAMQIMGREVTEEYTRLETVWRDPSTPTVAAKADAVSKLYANGQGPIPKEQARIDLGYTATQREQMRDWDKQETEAVPFGTIRVTASSDGRAVNVFISNGDGTWVTIFHDKGHGEGHLDWSAPWGALLPGEEEVFRP